MVEQKYYLDLVPNDILLGVPCSQYDAGIRTLVFKLHKGPAEFAITEGVTARIRGAKPDGNVFEYPMTVDAEAGTVSVVITEQMSVIAGEVMCEVVLFNGATEHDANVIGSANFTLMVEASPIDMGVLSDSDIPAIETLINGGDIGDILSWEETGAQWTNRGTGDMKKSVYDQNDNGIVDNAEKVNGKTVARDVAADEYTNSQIDTELGNKVDKVAGKGLSANDYTDADKGKLDALPTATDLSTALSGKVDKEAGKGLSSNDYTNGEKSKLEGIESGAEKNVQSDWNQTDTGADDYIKNKPSVTGAEWGSISGTLADQTDLKTALDGKKNLQSAVVSPTASGSALAFIDSISQDAQGVISATKKNVTVDSTPTTGSANPVQSGAVATALGNLNQAISNLDGSAVKSVNGNTPTSGAVTVIAEDIPAEGVGDETVTGNPVIVNDAIEANAKGLSVSIEPVQDLHGYSKPWVGGSGKNLLPMTVANLKSVNTVGNWNGNVYSHNGIDYTIVLDNGENVLGIKANGTATAQSAFNLIRPNSLTIAAGEYKFGIPSASYNGNIRYRIYDGEWIACMALAISYNYPEEKTITSIDICMNSGASVSNLMFYPIFCKASDYNGVFYSYTNICPISGWDEVSAERTKKNLVDTTKKVLTSGSIYLGTTTRDGVCAKVKAGITYTFSVVMANAGNTNLYVKDVNASGSMAQIYQRTYLTFTPSYDCEITLWLYDRNFTSADDVTSFQLEIGSTATAHEPYQGQTATVTLPQTVYGGDVDFNTGKVTVTHAIVDLGTLTWSKNTNYNTIRFYADISGAKPAVSQDVVADIISDKYEAMAVNSLIPATTNGMSLSVSSSLSIRDNAMNSFTPEQFKTAIAGTQLCYELASPTTVTLTPAQLTLLQGYNILTADGTINLTYLGSMASNVQAEIDEFESATNNLRASIAFVESTTAKTSHAVGDYIILNDMLCKVIASISTGETITIGTNVQTTTLGAELKAIWAEISA